MTAPATNSDGSTSIVYKFDSWTNATGTNANGSVTMNAATTVTANYAQTNGIKYWKNDGVATDPYFTDNNGYLPSDKVTLLDGPSRPGYTFDGWTVVANTGTGLKGQQTVSSLGTATSGYYNLYAKWTQITTTVTYDPKATLLCQPGYRHGYRFHRRYLSRDLFRQRRRRRQAGRGRSDPVSQRRPFRQAHQDLYRKQ